MSKSKYALLRGGALVCGRYSHDWERDGDRSCDADAQDCYGPFRRLSHHFTSSVGLREFPWAMAGDGSEFRKINGMPRTLDTE